MRSRLRPRRPLQPVTRRSHGMNKKLQFFSGRELTDDDALQRARRWEVSDCATRTQAKPLRVRVTPRLMELLVIYWADDDDALISCSTYPLISRFSLVIRRARCGSLQLVRCDRRAPSDRAPAIMDRFRNHYGLTAQGMSRAVQITALKLERYTWICHDKVVHEIGESPPARIHKA